MFVCEGEASNSTLAEYARNVRDPKRRIWNIEDLFHVQYMHKACLKVLSFYYYTITILKIQLKTIDCTS